MRPALDWTAPLHGITQALGAITAITAVAAVVAGDHAIPEEVIPIADAAGVTPGGGLILMTHCDHTPLDDATIGHDPVEGIDPATEVGPDPREDAPVINPILQITNIPGML